jgi:hypothetical protein
VLCCLLDIEQRVKHRDHASALDSQQRHDCVDVPEERHREAMLSEGQQPHVKAGSKAVRLDQAPVLVAYARQAVDLEDRASIERAVVVERPLESKRIIEGHRAGLLGRA